MKKIITLWGLCSLFFCGCDSGCGAAEKKESLNAERPLAVTLIYQKRIVDSFAGKPGIKKLDLNNIRIRTREDFVKLFDRPEELFNIKVTEFKPENPKMHGRIFTAAQKISGVVVLGSFVKVQTFADGLIRSFEYAFSVDGRKISVKPGNFPEALKKELSGGRKNGELSPPLPLICDPLLFNDQGEPQLVWLTDLTVGNVAVMRYIISQKNNKVLYKMPLGILDLKH